MTRPRLVKLSRWLALQAGFGRPRLLWALVGIATAPLIRRVLRADLERNLRILIERMATLAADV